MVEYDVTVGGQQIENIYEVSTENSSRGKIGKATIVGANGSPIAYSSGDEVIIKKNGRTEFRGFLMSTPTGGRDDPEIEIEAWSKKAQLKFEEVNRVFYNMDTGEIVRRALEEEAYNLDSRTVHRGSSMDGWSSNIPVFELGNVSSQDLQERGSNFVFCGFREGQSGNYYARYDVPSFALPTFGGLARFRTRLLANNSGQQFKMEIEIRDRAGNQYVWDDLSLRGNDFETFDLRAEDAHPDGEVTTDGTLEYRFRIDGDLPESRGIAIDYATTTSYATEDRDTDLSTAGVQNTGNRIVRRHDGNVLELVKDLELEDDFISFVDNDDVLHYEPLGDTSASKAIDYDETAVVDAEFNRDYSRIDNKVTVQGAGDIQVTLRDDASIRFYGVSPRHEPITDPDIQTRDDAIRRGQGYLRENAWNDTAMKFEVADASFADVRVGQAMQVTWPSENIDREWEVTDVETDEWGFVTISLSGVV